MYCSTPGLPVLHYLPEFAQSHVHQVSDAIQLSPPLSSLLLLPSIFPSIRVFSNESVLCIRWPKYWSFSFSFNPSNEYSGLISFRIDKLDLLDVQVTRVFLASLKQCLAVLKQYLLNHSKALSGLPFSRSSKIQCLYLANWLKSLCEATSDSFPSHLF